MRIDDFLADPHGAKYRDVVDLQPLAFARVLAVLSDSQRQRRMADLARLDLSALSAVVSDIEGDRSVAAALASPIGNRFRQATGVAVRMVMESMGWSKAGRPGPVLGSSSFKRAERYEPPPPLDPTERLRAAHSALRSIALIGDEAERAETARHLMTALAASRASEGRPF